VPYVWNHGRDGRGRPRVQVDDAWGARSDYSNSDRWAAGLNPCRLWLGGRVAIGASQLDALRIWYYICKEVMGATMESAITVKGQATIPRAVRKHLGLKPGDRVKFFMHPDGSVVLLPKLPASALRGIVKSRRRRPVTIEEMTDVAREGAASVASRARRR
jgi:antitoxin PrlF